MTKTDYYAETIAQSLCEMGLSDALTPEQIRQLADDVCGSVENESLAFHVPSGPDPRVGELERKVKTAERVADERERLLKRHIESGYRLPVNVDIRDGRVEVSARR